MCDSVRDFPRKEMETEHSSSNVSLDGVSHESITGVSLEYDDYPLDLISPLVVNNFTDQQSNLPLTSQRTECHVDTAAIFRNAWKEMDCGPPPMRDKLIDRTVGDEIITDYGRRSWCVYPENTDVTGDVFVNNRTSLCLSQQSNCTDKDTVIPRDISEETHFIETPPLYRDDSNLCDKCRQIWIKLWKPCLLKYQPLPDKPGFCDQLRHMLMCPPHGCMSKVLSLSLSVFLLWGISWTTLRQSALVGGQIFTFFVMAILSYLAGSLMKLIKSPPLPGKVSYILT